MLLNKTNFIHFLQCPKSFWVYKNDNEKYPEGKFSAFMQKLVREGYEVEAYVKALFEARVNASISFQKVFKSDDGLFARADGFDVLDDSQVHLYEVKSSTSVKTGGDHSHIKDACFQTITAERSGQKVDRVFIIHLNGDYVRDGEVEPEKLFCIVDVTDDVRFLYQETSDEIDEALSLLSHGDINRNGCSCLSNSRTHHCDTFNYFNPGIPEYSIYSLPRLSEAKRLDLIDQGIYGLLEVSPEYGLSEVQRLVLRAAQGGEPVINLGAVHSQLGEYEFPLYFFDYETFASAIPMIDGANPHKHFPVQYSLHILHKDGRLEHKEFLQDTAQLPLNLIEQMKSNVGDTGSIVSWHASFEKTQNREMAKWFSEHTAFLNDLNERTVDLEDIFKKSYVDARFKGSTSIKKVLPVICPHLGYDDLDVQDGAAAMDAWKKMIEASPDDTAAKAKALLAYCEMDTFAMVEIYRFLKAL